MTDETTAASPGASKDNRGCAVGLAIVALLAFGFPLLIVFINLAATIGPMGSSF